MPELAIEDCERFCLPWLYFHVFLPVTTSTCSGNGLTSQIEHFDYNATFFSTCSKFWITSPVTPHLNKRKSLWSTHPSSSLIKYIGEKEINTCRTTPENLLLKHTLPSITYITTPNTFLFKQLSLKSEKSQISPPDSARAYLLHHLPLYQRKDKVQRDAYD